MALKLDDNLLVELGLGGLPAEEKKAFLAHIYEKLELNVGVRLAEQMSEQQLAEFEQLINAGDESGAFRWLESTFPGYKEVVAEEFEKLKNEIRPLAPQILAASQQSAATGPASVVPGSQQYAPQPVTAPVHEQPQPGYGPAPMPQQPYYGQATSPQQAPEQPRPPFPPAQQQ
jgi:hypothetical protein